MKVYVVYGDDHDYDQMSSWLVGVYESEEKADKAALEDSERYWKENPGSKRKGFPNMEIWESELK